MNSQCKLEDTILYTAIGFAKDIKKTSKYRLVAIIADKRGRILSIGRNSFEKTHPKQAYYAKKNGSKHRIYLHAEMDALVRCKEKGYVIYIARVNRIGEPMLAKPCKICADAIKDSGIEKIFYT